MASSPQQTSTQVANLAIAHCGISKPMAALETERSVEAQMCRTFYDLSRQATLRDFNWTFALKQIAPNQVALQPTPEWLYAYQFPSDALRISRFMSWRLKNDTRQSRIPYTIMQPVANTLSTLTPLPAAYTQTSGLWIYTDWPGVNVALPTIIEYVFDNTNVSQWTPDFIVAMSYMLASFIAPTLIAGDPAAAKVQIMAQYQTEINKAQSSSLNEEQRPEEPEAEWIRSRQGEQFALQGASWVAEPAGFSVQ